MNASLRPLRLGLVMALACLLAVWAALAGCYGNVTGPTPAGSTGDESHAGDPCYVIVAKLPLKPPYQADTLIVWGHITGCHS